jgi:hypothetical protein
MSQNIKATIVTNADGSIAAVAQGDHTTPPTTHISAREWRGGLLPGPGQKIQVVDAQESIFSTPVAPAEFEAKIKTLIK